MGWDGTNIKDHQKMVEWLIQPRNGRLSDDAQTPIVYACLEHEVTPDGILWSVWRVRTLNGEAIASHQDYIRCTLLERTAHGWACKHLSEDEGPYYYSCPLRFLEMTTCCGMYAHQWRVHVRQHHGSPNTESQAGLMHSVHHG